jgi:ABC-type transport system involved in multi-copper enzyme maturation permease subunit
MLWPVASREARAAARAPRTYGWRAAITAIGILVIPISLWIARGAPSQGRAVFVGISAMAFAYCLFGGVARTADAIAEEKRENTLGLLFLTDLKVADVITGKLLASSATLFFGLLALLPLLGIPALLGGVTSRDLWQMSLCLVNTLFFSISFGFLVSTFFRQGWVTISIGMGAMLGLCVVFPLSIGRVMGPLFMFSPTAMLGTIIYDPGSEVFWQSLCVTHCLAWLNLLLTAHFLPKFWQERPRSAQAQAWWEKIQRWRFGGARTRTRFRTRLLNTNPLYWLSGREQVSSGGLMAFLMFLAALSLTSEWRGIFYGLLVMHATLLMRMSSAASHALSEDRKSGALELLLATELSVREVLKGRWMALGRQFLGPILIVGIWHLFTTLWLAEMSPLENTTGPMFTCVLVLPMAWLGAGWCGMWMGLRARHPIAAIWGTLTAVLLLPWLAMSGLFSALAFFQMLPEMRFGGNAAYITIGCFAWGIYLLFLIAWTTRRVKTSFREAATDRFSDTQPVDWRPVWRVTWKAAAVTALVIAAIWSWRGWINYRGQRELHEVLAAHPNFSLRPPNSPIIPAEKNLARWSYLDPLNSPVLIGKTIPKLAAAGYRTGSPTQSWRNGVKTVSKFPDDLEADVLALHQAARERPFIQFSALGDTQQGRFNTQMRLVNIVSILALRAEKRLEHGEQPLDDILLGVRFADSFVDTTFGLEPRQQMLSYLIQAIYDGIQDDRWGDAELKTLQETFASMEVWRHFENYRHAVVRSVAIACAQGPLPGFQGGQVFIGGIPVYTGNPPGPRLPGEICSQEARLIQSGLDEIWPIDPKNPSLANGQRLQPGWGETFDMRLLGSMNYALSEGIRVVVPTQTAINQVVIACAIERFRKAEGRLPRELGELKPKYLQTIPNDIVNGQPLIYRLKGNGYLLYSVAMDGQDHLGVPERPASARGLHRDQRDGDWVWSYKQ